MLSLFRSQCHLLLLLLLLLCGACGNIELPGDDEKPSTEKPGEKGDTVRTDPDGMLTVAEALRVDVESFAEVSGYIVGYINGSSLSQCVFGLPDKVNTNFLIADSPNETSVESVLPVRLTTTGANFRQQLNLYDNPELLGARIAVQGKIETYFRINGIKNLDSFILLDDIEDPDNPDNPDNPENPDNPDTLQDPAIDSTPQPVTSGR